MLYSNPAKGRCKADGELEASGVGKLASGLLCILPCDCFSLSPSSSEGSFLRLAFERAPCCQQNRGPHSPLTVGSSHLSWSPMTDDVKDPKAPPLVSLSFLETDSGAYPDYSIKSKLPSTGLTALLFSFGPGPAPHACRLEHSSPYLQFPLFPCSCMLLLLPRMP